MSLLLESKSMTYATPTGVVLASNVSFKLGAGQILLVTGPNGSGKSSLLRVLMGEWKPIRGQCSFGVRSSEVRVLPQLQNTDYHLPMTLGDLLKIAVKSRLDVARVLEIGLLEERHLGLAWSSASGGERKRTLLTRILLQDPSLILLDEPMNHLDRESRQLIREVLVRFVARQGGKPRGLVLVSHEMSPGSDFAGTNVVHLQMSATDATSVTEYSHE